jgi:hypothetical protein
MALIVKTSDPQGLLSNIKKEIDTNSIVTWSYDSDGDFTHTPEQWQYKGWMRAKIYQGEIHFGFLGNKVANTTKLIYAVYHGRFAEMLLNHFDDKFSNVQATSMPTNLDKITNLKTT